MHSSTFAYKVYIVCFITKIFLVSFYFFALCLQVCIFCMEPCKKCIIFIQIRACDALNLVVDTVWGFGCFTMRYIGRGMINFWAFFCCPFHICEEFSRFFPCSVYSLPLHRCFHILLVSLLHFHSKQIGVYHPLPQCEHHYYFFWVWRGPLLRSFYPKLLHMVINSCL